MRLTAESLHYGHLLTPWHTAIPISVLGIVAYQQGNLQEAHEQLTESLKIWRTVGDPRGLVFCMLYLGMTTVALNDIEATRSILEESNRIAEAKMDRWAHAFGLDMLGMVALSQEQNEEALDLFNTASIIQKRLAINSLPRRPASTWDRRMLRSTVRRMQYDSIAKPMLPPKPPIGFPLF
jgi:hypothetical protein